MTNSKKNDSDSTAVTGIFVNAKNMHNDGDIIADGEKPQIHINTDEYSGLGNLIVREFNLDEEIKKKVFELEKALVDKDEKKVVTILKYIGDKSVDVLIAIVISMIYPR